VLDKTRRVVTQSGATMAASSGYQRHDPHLEYVAPIHFRFRAGRDAILSNKTLGNSVENSVFKSESDSQQE